MTSTTRVALVITALHEVAGGAERVLCDVANGLNARGYSVTVITDQNRNGPPFYRLDYGVRRLDGRRRHRQQTGPTPIHAVNRGARRGRLLRTVAWVLRYGPKIVRLRRMLRITAPDVCVGFLPSSFPYVEIAKTGLGIRTIASLHNVPERDLGGDATRWDPNPVDIWVRRRALRTADAVTVLLPSFVDQLPDEVRSTTYVVPNAVHAHGGPPADVRTSPDDNIVLAVGRLTPAKDHRTLIDAWSELEVEFPNWRVEIFGDGPLRADLEDRIRELGLARIAIRSPVQEIGEHFSNAKLFVMPSRFEGFGLATTEALAAGLPVVGFADCEGTNEIVEHDSNGVLVDPTPGRSTALAKGLRSLMVDEARRRRLASRSSASVERFAPEAVIDRWECVIRAASGTNA